MDPLRAANDGLYVLAAILAWIAARRLRSYRPIAAFMTWMAASGLLAPALRALRAGSPRPYSGAARISFHVDQLITLSWSFLFAALCIHFFLGKRVRLVFASWALAFVVCCLAYPALSKARLGVFYEAVAVTTIGVTWPSIFWGMLKRRGLQPNLSHLVLILYAATDAAVFGLQRAGGFFENWPAVELANIVLLLACCGVHVWWLGRRRLGSEATA